MSTGSPIIGGTIFDKALRQAERAPDAAAVLDAGTWHSYGALVTQAERLAAGLWTLGLRPGDVVSFQLPNWYEAAVINLAACLAGWVCNPIVPIYREAEVAGTLADCASGVLFVPGEWRGFDYAGMGENIAAGLASLKAVVRVRDPRDAGVSYRDLLTAGAGRPAPRHTVDPAAVKLVMYTSGTTGRAKGVLHSHSSLPAAVNRAVEKWGLQQNDTWLMPSPVTHVTGYCCGLEMPFERGMRTVLMERWSASEAIDLIRRHDVRATVGATPFLQELVAESERTDTQLPSLRVFACGGAAVPPDLVRRANAVLTGRAFRVYGATEAPLVTFGIADSDDPELCAETDGKLNGYDVRIADPAGDAAMEAGREGEILVRGPGLFLGYTDSGQTAEAFTGDGFFRTGDLGILGSDGALTITGRKKDLIIRGGENISAKEIEDVLHRHPGLIEVAAVAMPDRRMGETVCVYVVAEPGVAIALEDVCRTILAAGLARQKCPERLERLEALPRTPSGKVRKDVLRRMIAEKLAEAG